jgi:putative ABC transport system permease protein
VKEAWRLALRDLRAGGRGLWLLALCLFLGTAALSGIGSLSASILSALETQSHAILGGDLEMRVSQRRATVEEGAAFAGAASKVTELVRTRAMAERIDGRGSTLIALKAVDDHWPLIGSVTIQPAVRPHGLQAAIAPALADKLKLRVGDYMRVGMARLQVIGLVTVDPDSVGEGFNLGPTVLVDPAGLDATGVIQPGSLYESRYRLLLPPGTDAKRLGDRFVHLFPSAGWTARAPEEAAGTLRRTITQLGQFLLLVGLAALAIAGIGVGSGVSAYLAGKTRAIATLKVLGARSGTIAAMFLIQLGVIAGGGIIVGLMVGAAVPPIIARVAGNALPVTPQLGLYPVPLAVAAGLGVIVALLFALPALARARSVPAATLLRDSLAPAYRPTLIVIAGMAVLLAALVALAVLTASDRSIALGFVGATIALVFGLWLLGLGLRWVLARLPRPRLPLIRLALANLHRPGAQTDRLVVALGLGFSLFVALAVIDTSLSSEIQAGAPAKAPRFFVMDLQPPDEARFRAAVAGATPAATIEAVPSLRGAIVALKGERVADMKALPEGAWILRGDRTVTWSAAIPPRNRVTQGKWWPPGYAGPPLVSMEESAAKLLGLHIGDTITVAVLGVEIPARIAALRQVDWGGFGLNFALVFSPGYIQEAPHNLLATIYAPADRDNAINDIVGRALPSVTMVRTGDVISQIGDLLAQIGFAIRAAAAVTIAAGIVVLVGAVTASGQARRYDVMILKLLGGSRRQVLLGQALEYLLLSALLSVVALAVGVPAGWYVVTKVFAIAWAPDAATLAVTLGASIAITLVVGMLGSLPALRARPAQGLRDL